MIDVREPMRMTSCGDCGIVFGLSEWLYQKRAADGGEVFCPNGHRNKAAVSGDGPAALLELLAELRNTRHLLAVLQQRETASADTTPPDKEELRRRSRTLANTAKLASDGGRICQFCGSKINAATLHTHIMRRHLDKLSGVRV